MSDSKKTVSEDALRKEWMEIQAAKENPAKFKVLYNRYFEQIFRFIYKRTDSESLSADLCSQVFCKAMQKLSGYEYKGVPFSSWLYRIASNEINQYFRETSKKRTVSLESKQITELMDDIDFDDISKQSTGKSGQISKMIQELDNLKESDLQLIEMRFFEQRSFKEIAEIMNLTESNAKVRTYRILERIRLRMLKNQN